MPAAAMPAAAMPAIAPEGPVCLPGDLHGRRDLLERFLQLRRARFPEAQLVFPGDALDRGPDSAGVLRLLMEEEARGAVCLAGNHEAMLLAFLDDPNGAGRGWLSHGGLETALSYQAASLVSSADDRLRLRDRLRAAMGEEVVAWLRGLPLWWQSGNLVAVHAAMDPSLPPEAQAPGVMQWGHPDFGHRLRPDGLWVAHGHVVVERARIRRGTIALDTGAYASGRLSFALIDPALPASERVMLALTP